jgi:hypothetical protein
MLETHFLGRKTMSSRRDEVLLVMRLKAVVGGVGSRQGCLIQYDMLLHQANEKHHVVTKLFSAVYQQLDYKMQVKLGCEVLILGAGWTSTFLIPLLQDEKVEYVATSTTGRSGTIKFIFEPDAIDSTAFKVLPEAATILITFPLRGLGQSKKLIDFYHGTHTSKPHFIQLGSIGIWLTKGQAGWVDRHSPYDTNNERAIAEDEIMQHGGCVLNLAGLWGGGRSPPRFVRRAASTKALLKGKSSLHLIHGRDVARAIYAVHQEWPGPSRWMLTDQFVYDWWALLAEWGSAGANKTEEDATGEALKWVGELMEEDGVRALPRSVETLGRACSSTEFWNRFNLSPVRAGLQLVAGDGDQI